MVSLSLRKMLFPTILLSGKMFYPMMVRSVINTLTHRAKTVSSNSQLLKEEEDDLKQALQKCKYPVWTLNRASIKSNRSHKDSNNIRNNPTTNINKPHKVVPYINGLSETCKNIYSKHGIQIHFKGGRTIKDLIVKPKDRDTICQKSRVIYRYKCGRVDCEEDYIWKSDRIFA